MSDPLAINHTNTANETHDLNKTIQILEAALLSSQEPLSAQELRRLFNHEFTASLITNQLEQIRDKWTNSCIELVQVASGWRFQVRPEIQPYLDRLTPQKCRAIRALSWKPLQLLPIINLLHGVI